MLRLRNQQCRDYLRLEKLRPDFMAQIVWAETHFRIYLVFGRRAGLAAARTCEGRQALERLTKSQVEAAAREMLAPFERVEGESPYDVHRDLQETMQNYVGIFRNEEDLNKGLGEIRS